MSEAANVSNAEMQIIYGITVDGAKLFFKAVGAGASLSATAIKFITGLVREKHAEKKSNEILNSLETKDGAKFFRIDNAEFDQDDPKSVVSRLNNMNISWRMADDGVDNGMSYLVIPGKDVGVLNNVLNDCGIKMKQGFTVSTTEAPKPERRKELKAEDVVHEDKKEGPLKEENADPAIHDIIKARQKRSTELSPNSSEVSGPTSEKKSGSPTRSNILKGPLMAHLDEAKEKVKQQNASHDSLKLTPVPASAVER